VCEKFIKWRRADLLIDERRVVNGRRLLLLVDARQKEERFSYLRSSDWWNRPMDVRQSQNFETITSAKARPLQSNNRK